MCPRMLVALACFGGGMSTSACAQDWAKDRLETSPRHLEYEKVKHGDRVVNCFVAYPESTDKVGAVVVIHEIFGLTDWVRGVADQLAEAGYVAIAPDLLSGTGPNGGGTESMDGDALRRAILELPQDQITADLNAVVDHVSKLPVCNGKVSVVGFCWGGRQSFAFATKNDRLKAAFVFYGNGPEELSDVERIACPVYGFYGGNDARVNATIPTSEELMKKANKRYEPVTYDGAGHGFLRAGEAPDATPANRKARQEAWQRFKDLLAEAVGSAE